MASKNVLKDRNIPVRWYGITYRINIAGLNNGSDKVGYICRYPATGSVQKLSAGYRVFTKEQAMDVRN